MGEVAPDLTTPPSEFELHGDRYDALVRRQAGYTKILTACQRICVGETMVRRLAELRVFMIGCGAIGCEMLKNYALLGIGRGANVRHALHCIGAHTGAGPCHHHGQRLD